MKRLSKETLKNKNVRYGGYATLITIAVLIGAIVINLIVRQVPGEIDLTKNKLFTLTDQTRKVLDNLDIDIAIYGLYKTGEESKDVTAVISRYENSSDRIRVEYIDPDKNPTFVAKYDTEGKGIPAGSLIVESAKEFKVINPFDLYDISYSNDGQPRIMGLSAESRITSAILFVTSGYTPVIYELTGHGEASFSAFGITPTLEKENYSVRQLNLITSSSVPEDASVLVIMSPKYDCTPGEAEKILSFLENGGRGIILMDFISFQPMPVFSSILQSFGVEIVPGIIMESDPGHLYSAEIPNFISPDMAPHEILQPLIDNKMTMLLPNTQAIRELDMKKRELEITPILTSSKTSWLRTTENSARKRLPTDIPGPLAAAMSITKKKFETDEPEGYRILVAGTSGILAPIPPFGLLKGNVEFVLNSLSWVNSRSETISIRSKSLFKLPLRMSAGQVIIYSGIVILVIPIIIILFGLIIWLRRRHL